MPGNPPLVPEPDVAGLERSVAVHVGVLGLSVGWSS